MRLTFRPGGRLAFALLALLVYLAMPVSAQTGKKDDIKKEISDVEKQIADLTKKLEELKKGPQPPATSVSGTVPASAVAKMNWRCIGPANMGGRVTAIAVVESDPSTYYVATASGGLLKTTNNGTTFSHLFDKEATVSIGDVAVAPSNPEIVWVGTGEANPRNSVSYGDGVYKSTDGGKKWTNMGLKKSFQIGKIIIHPTNPDIVYVGALGRLYGPNEERGLFKTEDGGKTWKKILYVDDKTGVIDMRMDPFEPNTLLVGMWERKRDGFDGEFGPSNQWPSPDQYGPEVSHGPGGGVFRSTDAGKTWKKLSGDKATSGLPAVKTGRIGLDFSRKTKGLVYAIIDSEKVGMGRPALTVTMGMAGENEKGGGAKVESVVEDGPVAKAGLKVGDIITALDGTKVTDYDDVLDFMVKKKANDVVKFTYKREGKEATAEVKLAARAGGGQGKGGPGGGGFGGGKGGGQGKGAQQLLPGFTPDLSDFQGPVKVGSVPKDGQAAKAGVKAGMVVTAVEGKAVTSFAEFRNELRTGPKAENPRNAGDKVKISFKDGDKKLDATLALELMEMTFGGGMGGGGMGGGGGGAAGIAGAARPFIMDRTVGGQQGNVHKDQGKEGMHTGGVYKSTDSGLTWTRVNSLNPRPFYYSTIRVDPNDEKTVYVLGDTTLWKSTNGGERFAAASARTVHPDHHALWIDHRDSRHMIIGCDGGFYTTYDSGTTWDHLNVVALGQLYHVCVDNKKPYNVYGGFQDNGSWGGPSMAMRSIGLVNDDWIYLNGGDGFVCRVDAVDPDIVYCESQGGAINRKNLRTGESRFIGLRGGFGGGGGKGGGKDAGEPQRFNWNTPFILSSHNPNIFYLGSQQVYRSIARGDNLKSISPELTRSKEGSMTALAESPRNPEVLWAGTDDGNLWVTRDGGEKWTNVYDKLKAAGLPGPRWVATIEASRTVEGRAYVCLDAHRSDDDKPYLFVTEDFGETWKPITNNLPQFGSTRVLREDYINPNVLYCGTEFGIWVSVNRGQSWANLNGNLPTVAVHEIAQPTTASEIVVATHGRSIWVVDINSIRQMAAQTTGKGTKAVDPLTEPVTLFAPAPATRWRIDTSVFPYSRDVRKFYGTNPQAGATIDYLLTAPAKAVSLKIVDVNGTTVRSFPNVSGEVGFHRNRWDLSSGGGGGGFGGGKGGGGGGFGGGGGGAVPAGGYRVVLTVDGKEFTQAVIVENDPKADARAIITFEETDLRVEEGGDDADKGTGGGDDTAGIQARRIVPFIPKSRE